LIKLIKMNTNKVKDGLFGLCIGDALGVPVEFYSRKQLEKNPITDMIGYKNHNQPPGTWSDDSSLAFCLAESLCNGFNIQDIANKFCKWYYEGYWTPYGRAFDIGFTTMNAIQRLKAGIEPSKAGLKKEQSNGNGSLMRTLPLAFYVENMGKEKFEIIHQVSALTHAHPKSLISCGIYVDMAINLLKGHNINEAYKQTIKTINEYYKKSPYANELNHFKRILEEDISKFPKEKIFSDGYVIHTLEASLWCCMNNNSYKETVLAAVNLGEDTDTTGAVAGGLAGIFYGFENIPKNWVEQIARKDNIIDLAERLNNAKKFFKTN